MALRAPDIELKDLLSGFSATPSYAGAPMIRTSCLAFRAHRSWIRLRWTAFGDADTTRRVGRGSDRRATHRQRLYLTPRKAASDSGSADAGARAGRQAASRHRRSTGRLRTRHCAGRAMNLEQLRRALADLPADIAIAVEDSKTGGMENSALSVVREHVDRRISVNHVYTTPMRRAGGRRAAVMSCRSPARRSLPAHHHLPGQPGRAGPPQFM